VLNNYAVLHYFIMKFWQYV